MPLLVTPTGGELSGNLSTEGLDLRIGVQLFPPTLTASSLHTFLAFDSRHSVRPQHYHEVSTLAMLSMPPCQPSIFLTASAIATLLPPLHIHAPDHSHPSCGRGCRACRTLRRR
jgi:hypothetical protein